VKDQHAVTTRRLIGLAFIWESQNALAQNGWLKHELGFQGYILSDWAATHSGVDSALNGLDMTM
jgi:beta-glucosidase-like glycosyl hydrolase